jgi:hypothetical protein
MKLPWKDELMFILIGIAYYLVLTRVLHRQINLG